MDVNEEIFHTEEFRKFHSSLINKDDPRRNRIRNCWNMNEIWSWVYHHGWPHMKGRCEHNLFIKIVSRVNAHIFDALCNGELISLPHKMGLLCAISKPKSKPVIVDGKVHGLPVDWKKTVRLWYTDPEARKNKTVVHGDGSGCFFDYRFVSRYSNNSYYKFFPSRGLLRELCRRVENGETSLIHGLERPWLEG